MTEQTRRDFLNNFPVGIFILAGPWRFFSKIQQEPPVTLEDLINQLADEQGNDDNVIEDSEKTRLRTIAERDERLYLLYNINDLQELQTETKITYSELYRIMRGKEPMGPGKRLYNLGELEGFYRSNWNQDWVLRIEIRYNGEGYDFRELRVFEKYENLVTGESRKINLVEE